MNTLMILVAMRLGGGKVRPLRAGIGAAFGAGMALALRALGCGRAAALWLPTAVLMMSIAGGSRSVRRIARDSACLFCAGGLLGGIVLCIHGATGSLFAAYAVCGMLALWMIVSLLRGGRAAHGRMLIECGVRGRKARMEAIIDSGNTLTDYLTKRSVIVMSAASEKAKYLAEGVPSRPIFADTAGGRQMMQLILPDETTLIVNGRRLAVCAAVALAPALDSRSPALVPATLEDDKRV